MVFTPQEYEQIVASTTAEILKLGELKGGEYSGDEDRLLNFRRAGLNFGVPPELVLMIYAGKHWDSLMQYTNDLIRGVQRKRLEKLDGRIDDLINYLMLYKCMYVERERTE